MPASIDDVLTAIKNIVTAINSQTQTNTNLAGAQDFFNITAAAMIKTGPGRIARITLPVPGSADGAVYDAQNVSDLSRKIFVISHAATGAQIVDLPVQYGILIVPGSGMTVAGSFS